MLDLDLSQPVNMVRATVGDIDVEFISDSNISFLLSTNNDDVLIASRKALDYILAQVSYYSKEIGGDVTLEWDSLYNQLSARKKQLDKDSMYANSGSLFIFGGTSKTEMERVRNHSEYVGLGFTEREFVLQLESWGIDPENPYIRA